MGRCPRTLCVGCVGKRFVFFYVFPYLYAYASRLVKFHHVYTYPLLFCRIVCSFVFFLFFTKPIPNHIEIFILGKSTIITCHHCILHS